MVYAEFGGANRVYYGEFENREYDIFQIKIRSAALKTSCHLHTKGEQVVKIAEDSDEKS